MNKEINEMTKKELLAEYNSVVEQIERGSYGNYELRLQSAIEEEIDKRGYEIRTSYSLS